MIVRLRFARRANGSGSHALQRAGELNTLLLLLGVFYDLLHCIGLFCDVAELLTRAKIDPYV